MMRDFEQPPREEMTFETGSRPSIHQEIESRFGERYNEMLDELQASGDEPLYNFIVALPAEAKEKLSLAINGSGRDWMSLTKFGKENSSAVQEAITDWKKVIDIAADAQAVRNATRSFGDALDEI